MSVTKRDRLRVGLNRLGIAAGVIAVPVVWVLLVSLRTHPSFPRDLIIVSFVSAIGGVVVWFIFFVIRWVIDGFAFAGSNNEAAPPPPLMRGCE